MTADYRVHSLVGVVDGGELVYLAPLPDGPIVVLEGIGAVLWRLAIDEGESERDVAAAAARLTGTEAADIRDEVEAFLAELIARGLLTAVAEQASDQP